MTIDLTKNITSHQFDIVNTINKNQKVIIDSDMKYDVEDILLTITLNEAANKIGKTIAIVTETGSTAIRLQTKAKAFLTQLPSSNSFRNSIHLDNGSRIVICKESPSCVRGYRLDALMMLNFTDYETDHMDLMNYCIPAAAYDGGKVIITSGDSPHGDWRLFKDMWYSSPDYARVREWRGA